MSEDKEKLPIGHDVLVMMEKASRLHVISGFERRLLTDRVQAVEQYNKKAVISESQLRVIEEMARRFDEVTSR